MSQESEVKDNRTQTALSFPCTIPNLPATKEAFANAERQIVLSLESQTDAELLDTRRQSKIAGKFAWRIEVACDAQIFTRAQNMRGIKGSVSEGKGVTAAVRRRAKLIGCTPNTIFRHFKIANLIKEVENPAGNNDNTTVLEVLDEKGFYIAALTANNPQAALILFAKKKNELTRFRVSDAFRLLIREGLTKKGTTAQAVAAIRTATRLQRASYLKKLRGLLSDCPDTGLLSRLGLQDCLDDVSDEIEEMFDEDVCIAIRKAWSPACQTEVELSAATNFPIEIVTRVMRGRLYEEFVKVPGIGSQQWQKVRNS